MIAYVMGTLGFVVTDNTMFLYVTIIVTPPFTFLHFAVLN